jgi:xylitol oxidase
MTEKLSNWAGNYTYSTTRLHQPTTLEQVQEVVSRCDKLRVLGSRHSFNGIADCNEGLISLEHLERVLVIDSQRQTVTVDGGLRYGDFCHTLQAEGYALHNLASLPHISVAGACATATHGSGDNNGNLATTVAALEFVTASGKVINLSREQHGEQFQGAVVGLGGLGVVTKLTLDLQPTFAVRQQVYDNLPLAQLENHFDEITGRAYSVSFFTDWQDETISQVWLKQRITDEGSEEGEATLFGATPAPTHRHPIVANSPENCTAQMGIPGPG